MDLHGGDGDDEADEDEDDEPDEEEEVDIRELDNEEEEEEEEEQEIPEFVAREAAAVRTASTQLQQKQKPRLEAIVARTAAAKQNARKGKIEDREFKMTRGDGGMLRAVNN